MIRDGDEVRIERRGARFGRRFAVDHAQVVRGVRERGIGRHRGLAFAAAGPRRGEDGDGARQARRGSEALVEVGCCGAEGVHPIGAGQRVAERGEASEGESAALADRASDLEITDRAAGQQRHHVFKGDVAGEALDIVSGDHQATALAVDLPEAGLRRYHPFEPAGRRGPVRCRFPLGSRKIALNRFHRRPPRALLLGAWGTLINVDS